MKMTLRQMRRVQDITQAQMADLMKVHVNTYAEWERCPAKVQAGNLLRILRILGYSIRELRIFTDAGNLYEEPNRGE